MTNRGSLESSWHSNVDFGVRIYRSVTLHFIEKRSVCAVCTSRLYMWWVYNLLHFFLSFWSSSILIIYKTLHPLVFVYAHLYYLRIFERSFISLQKQFKYVIDAHLLELLGLTSGGMPEEKTATCASHIWQQLEPQFLAYRPSLKTSRWTLTLSVPNFLFPSLNELPLQMTPL